MKRIKSKTKSDIDIYVNENIDLNKLSLEVLDELINGITEHFIDIVNNRSSPKNGT